MKKQLWVSLLFFMGCQMAFSQSQPLVRASGQSSPSAETSAAQQSEKYKIAEAVYRKLVQARGDYRYEAPRFELSPVKENGALMDYDSMVITLENAAYEVCASFGNQRDAALATVLGHELIHYYEKHGWRRGFASEYSNLDIGMKLDTLQDKTANETQADYLGGFLAYSAGYGLFGKGPDLIENIYKAYRLPDTMVGYPTRADRDSMALYTARRVQKLVDAFEMANMLTAIRHYAEAKAYYSYVLREYQSREIFNNMGVAILLEVLRESKSTYFYPIELDLSSKSGKGSDDFAARRSLLLRQAIQQFDAAINLDPNYAPAYLNKACAFALLEDYTRARFYAEVEGRQTAQANRLPKTESDASILLGIIAASQGDSATAHQIFERESKKGSAIAAKNLRVLLKMPEEPSGSGGFAGLSTRTENIDSIELPAFHRNARRNKDLTQKIAEKIDFLQYRVPGKSSRVFMSRNDRPDGTLVTYFQLTAPNYAGKTAKGIALGATRAQITDTYKNLLRSIETPRGEMLVYKNMIFVLGPDGKLERWANYLPDEKV